MAQAHLDSVLLNTNDDTVNRLSEIAISLWNILKDRPELVALIPGSLLEARDMAQRIGPLGGISKAVESEYLARRQRDVAFGHELFGEPAWDMLLYLYAAHLRGEFVATSSLARASAVPPTTALRWVAHLEQAKLIERCTLKRDGRVRLLKLTRRALKLLDLHFAARAAPMPVQGSARPPQSAVPADLERGEADYPGVDDESGPAFCSQHGDSAAYQARPKLTGKA